MPNNQSGTDAVTLRDGRHVLIYNDFRTLDGENKVSGDLVKDLGYSRAENTDGKEVLGSIERVLVLCVIGVVGVIAGIKPAPLIHAPYSLSKAVHSVIFL